MSRHDDVLQRLRDKAFQYSADPLFEEAAEALADEIAAHDRARQEVARLEEEVERLAQEANVERYYEDE